MTASHLVHTTCPRDCPDACGIVAEVQGDKVVRLRGDKDHPVTQGFLCHRTSRFLSRQYDPERLTTALIRQGGRQIPISTELALDVAAERLSRILAESGPAAILHYRSGGSLGMLKMLGDYLFEELGPCAVKGGDICSGGGDAAQLMDFGVEDSNDLFDLYNAKHIINWGKNVYVSNVHLIPVLREARRRGASVTLIDPVATRSRELADEHLAVRPDGDLALGLAVARLFFERGRISREAEVHADHLPELRALCFARPMSELLLDCDLPLAAVERLADRLLDGPTAILVGWGMQRRLRGASHVRMLDALSLLSGNLFRKGGGVSFYFKRRGAFDTSFIGKKAAPRVVLEPILGEELERHADPPIRALWVTAANPVAMLPDSARVARAIEGLELSVVVDAFETDTTRRASLVLPTTTMLEDDDLVGAYGHHWLGVVRPVVPPPPGVLTDLEIWQGLARRLGLGDRLAGTARDWKRRMLARAEARGLSLERLEEGPARSPFAAEVLFDRPRFATESGRAQLIHAAPPPDPVDRAYPLYLFSSSTADSQSSQWVEPLEGPLPARLHPDAAGGLPDGARARLVSAVGAIEVRLVHDAEQRRDLVVVPKGGSFDRGQSANTLVPARRTDHGDGAAYLSARVRVEPVD